MNKIAKIEISHSLLAGLLHLPEDVTIIGMGKLDPRVSIVFIECDRFPPVHPDFEIPVALCVVRKEGEKVFLGNLVIGGVDYATQPDSANSANIETPEPTPPQGEPINATETRTMCEESPKENQPEEQKTE